MSISNALLTGVSGLLANSSKVGKISDNIANANTDGYKRSFAQLVTTTASAGAAAAASGSGVRAVTGAEVDASGTLRSTARANDMAITGDGFFVVSKNPNDPVESNYMLTRAGAFEPDAEGNLRNAAGYYLAGYRMNADGEVGQVDRNRFGDLTTVNLNAVDLVGAPSKTMTMAGNLPAQETGLASPGDPFISTGEYYSPLGEAQRLGFSWQPTSNSSEWQLSIGKADGSASYGTVTVTFHDSGEFAGSPAAYSGATSTATAPAGFAFDAATGTATLTIDNGTTPQTLEVSIGEPDSYSGMTQFSGDYTPPAIDADGSETGALVRTEVDEKGTMFGVFDNGSRRPLFEIPVGQVTNPNGLQATNGNAFVLTRDSGAFRLSSAGEGTAGGIASGALESSNVEIARELTDLIQTQRAYSSNAKIVTTMDEMLDETMRLKR